MGIFDSKPARSKADYEMEWDGHDNFDFNRYLNRPIADPAVSSASRRLDFNNDFSFHIGRVVFSHAYTHCYKVMVGNCMAPLWCLNLVGTGLQPFGAVEINTIPDGAMVLVVRNPTLPNIGYIVGVIPDFITNNRAGKSDYITQASRCGLNIDTLYNDVTKFKRGGGIVNFSARRPADSIPVGEWGAICETGLGVFLDPFMAYLRADEANGFFVFQQGPKVRVAGDNYEFRTPHRELEIYNDQEEGYEYGGGSPYSWEMKGVLSRATQLYKNFTAAAAQINAPQYSTYEPRYDDQVPFFRTHHFGGYLGQGGKRQVILPAPSEFGFDVVNRQTTTPNRIGVFDETISLTGRYSMTSAKGIHIGKRPVIVAPKQHRRPEDISGDTQTNYKFCGLLGTGAAHTIKGEIPVPSTYGNLVTVAALMDAHAYRLNYENLIGVSKHDNDWYVPEEGDATPITTNMSSIPFSNLQTAPVMSAPTPVTARVDHRYTNTNYWLNESSIDLLDDGSVVIGDGYGAEIRMTGGNIYITCPGDVFLQPGRDVQAWAGRDTIIKAKKNVEVSATDQDVRIKAENRAMILGGNMGTEGGVLIESRTSCNKYDFSKVGTDAVTSGIILKSKDSQVIMDGSQVVLNARGSTQTGDAGIYMNAGSTGRIKEKAGFIERFLGNAAVDYFPGGIANEYWRTSAMIGTPLAVNGKLKVNGCTLVNGWIAVINGHIGTGTASTYKCQVVQLDPNQTTTTNSIINQINTRAQTLTSTFSTEQADDAFSTSIEWKNAEFSFRNKTQYNTNNFVLFESRWQQLARHFSSSVNTWTEKQVTATPDNTYPFPGREPMTTDNNYREIDFNLFDKITYKAKNRDDAAYLTPTYATPTSKAINGNYKVIG